MKEAIDLGIQAGFEESVAENCNESEACVSKKYSGCACLYVKWKNLPWYKKIFQKEPIRPSIEGLKSALLTLRIRNSVK